MQLRPEVEREAGSECERTGGVGEASGLAPPEIGSTFVSELRGDAYGDAYGDDAVDALATNPYRGSTATPEKRNAAALWRADNTPALCGDDEWSRGDEVSELLPLPAAVPLRALVATGSGVDLLGVEFERTIDAVRTGGGPGGGGGGTSICCAACSSYISSKKSRICSFRRLCCLRLVIFFPDSRIGFIKKRSLHMPSSKIVFFGASALAAVLLIVGTGLLAGYYAKTDSAFDWRAFSTYAIVANWITFAALIFIGVVNILTEVDNVSLGAALKAKNGDPSDVYK